MHRSFLNDLSLYRSRSPVSLRTREKEKENEKEERCVGVSG
jgi:hypothetical protein